MHSEAVQWRIAKVRLPWHPRMLPRRASRPLQPGRKGLILSCSLGQSPGCQRLDKLQSGRLGHSDRRICNRSAPNGFCPARRQSRRCARSPSRDTRCRSRIRPARVCGHLRTEHVRQSAIVRGDRPCHGAHCVRDIDRADLHAHRRRFCAECRVHARGFRRPIPARHRRVARAVAQTHGRHRRQAARRYARVRREV